MCLDSTKQAYLLLKAFDDAQGKRYLTRSEALTEAKKLADADPKRFASVIKDRRLKQIFYNQYLSSSVDRDRAKGFYRTRLGDEQLEILSRDVFSERRAFA